MNLILGFKAIEQIKSEVVFVVVVLSFVFFPFSYSVCHFFKLKEKISTEEEIKSFC
jgi:hypothetical protein